MPPAKRSSDDSDDADRRRSSRRPKPREPYYKEKLVGRRDIEWETDDCRGLHQTSLSRVSAEDKATKEKEVKGLALIEEHLLPAGWEWKSRVTLTSTWIVVAPCVVKDKHERIVGQNAYVNYVDVYEQYLRDGRTMDQIIAKGKVTSTAATAAAPSVPVAVTTTPGGAAPPARAPVPAVRVSPVPVVAARSNTTNTAAAIVPGIKQEDIPVEVISIESSDAESSPDRKPPSLTFFQRFERIEQQFSPDARQAFVSLPFSQRLEQHEQECGIPPLPGPSAAPRLLAIEQWYGLV